MFDFTVFDLETPPDCRDTSCGSTCSPVQGTGQGGGTVCTGSMGCNATEGAPW